MNELLIFALPAGMLLGAVFFGGLWWTVQKGLASTRPALWFGASLLLRSGIVLGGIYFIAGSDWRRLLLCLLGFVTARFVITRWSRAGEAGHAP